MTQNVSNNCAGTAGTTHTKIPALEFLKCPLSSGVQHVTVRAVILEIYHIQQNSALVN